MKSSMLRCGDNCSTLLSALFQLFSPSLASKTVLFSHNGYNRTFSLNNRPSCQPQGPKALKSLLRTMENRLSPLAPPWQKGESQIFWTCSVTPWVNASFGSWFPSLMALGWVCDWIRGRWLGPGLRGTGHVVLILKVYGIGGLQHRGGGLSMQTKSIYRAGKNHKASK